MTKFLMALLGMALTASLGLVFVNWRYKPAGLGLEVAKALLTVLTVAVGAQVAAFALTQYNELRRQQMEADQLRRGMLRALTRAFIAAKKVRRRARAESEAMETTGDRYVLRSSYCRCLERLSAVQLQIEEIAKNIENHGALFSDGHLLFASVSAMEEYLNRLVDEWENPPARFLGNPPVVLLSQLPRFGDLIGPYKSSEFRPEFVHSYYSALDGIRSALSLVKAVTWKARPSRSPANRVP